MVLDKLDTGRPICRVELVGNVPAEGSKLTSLLHDRDQVIVAKYRDHSDTVEINIETLRDKYRDINTQI